MHSCISCLRLLQLFSDSARQQVVFFEFIAYSPNDDIFASCRLAMEFLPGGFATSPRATVTFFVLPRGTSVPYGPDLYLSFLTCACTDSQVL